VPAAIRCTAVYPTVGDQQQAFDKMQSVVQVKHQCSLYDLAALELCRHLGVPMRRNIMCQRFWKGEVVGHVELRFRGRATPCRIGSKVGSFKAKDSRVNLICYKYL